MKATDTTPAAKPAAKPNLAASQEETPTRRLSLSEALALSREQRTAAREAQAAKTRPAKK